MWSLTISNHEKVNVNQSTLFIITLLPFRAAALAVMSVVKFGAIIALSMPEWTWQVVFHDHETSSKHFTDWCPYARLLSYFFPKKTRMCFVWKSSPSSISHQISLSSIFIGGFFSLSFGVTSLIFRKNYSAHQNKVLLCNDDCQLSLLHKKHNFLDQRNE